MTNQFASPVDGIPIGKIVKSNTHVDYVCQINGLGEAFDLPEPADYSFGTFVSIEMERPTGQTECLIGVIYNTLLMNPDFGNLGPRLSPRQELEVFTPDYLSETATLVGILAVGWCSAGGRYTQGVPALAATVNNPVQRLTADALRDFHCDEIGRPCLRYTPLLLGQNNPLVPSLLLTIIDELQGHFPGSSAQLAVMRNNIAWRSIVQPAG